MTLGINRGPAKDILWQLDNSMTIHGDANQCLNVVNTKTGLYLGEHSKRSDRMALETAEEAYRNLLAPKIRIEDNVVWLKAKTQAQPLRATPANIADLCLHRAVAIAVNRPRGWRGDLPPAICAARHYSGIAGQTLENPGRGLWPTVLDRFDSEDPLSQQVAVLINNLKATPFSTSLVSTVFEATGALVARLN